MQWTLRWHMPTVLIINNNMRPGSPVLSTNAISISRLNCLSIQIAQMPVRIIKELSLQNSMLEGWPDWSSERQELIPHLNYCWCWQPKHFKTINWSWRLQCRKVSSSHTELPPYFHIEPLTDHVPALDRRDINKNFTWTVFYSYLQMHEAINILKKEISEAHKKLIFTIKRGPCSPASNISDM